MVEVMSVEDQDKEVVGSIEVQEDLFKDQQEVEEILEVAEIIRDLTD